MPLSCTDLARELSVSKALVSPALEELSEYKLIYEVPSPNEKTKLYAAAENVNEVIQHVLKTREALILRQIQRDYSSLLAHSKEAENIDPSRREKLGEMILAGNLMLELLVAQKDLMQLPLELNQ